VQFEVADLDAAPLGVATIGEPRGCLGFRDAGDAERGETWEQEKFSVHPKGLAKCVTERPAWDFAGEGDAAPVTTRGTLTGSLGKAKLPFDSELRVEYAATGVAGAKQHTRHVGAAARVPTESLGSGRATRLT
jgi:hypothetical protein